METTVKLYSLSYNNTKTYLAALLFIAGNLALPQLFHLSPLLNSWLFGMPLPAVVPAILLKSVILALAAGYVAHRFQRVTLLSLLAVVLAYQILGTLGEWAMSGSFHDAIQDFRIGIPGMLLQIVGGYAVIRYLIRK